MSILFDDIEVKIDPESVRIGGSWEAGIDKPWSSDLVKLCYNLLPKDKQTNMLDIGANTGTFSLLPVCMPKLKVHSYEPNPEVFRLLNENIKLNNIQNQVETYELALSNNKKSVTFKVPIDGESGFGCIGEPKRFNKFKSFNVKTDRIDNSHWIFIDIIKIDTEGCEKFVLEGAKETINFLSPILLVEYQPKNTAQFGYNVEDIDELLESWGYKGEMVSCEDKLYRKII